MGTTPSFLAMFTKGQVSVSVFTLKYLSIGTLKIIDIPYTRNGKLMFLSVPVFNHIIIGL